MAKFAIECPKCGSVSTGRKFIWTQRMISCGTCGNEIDVRASHLISKVCPNPECGKTFVYDQTHRKRDHWKCPSCGKEVDARQAATVAYKMVTVTCPQCTCAVEIDKTQEMASCPVCDYQFKVKSVLARQELVNDTGISVLRYEGDNSTFVWKHPIEDFNSGSKLIVHESQEAVFFLGGNAIGPYGAGTYTLDTENLPILKKFTPFPTGEQEPFHAEVYYVNKTVQMGMKWGTDSRVHFIDPATQIPLDIGASGEMNIAVSDSLKLLIKLVGTTGGLRNKQILSAQEDSSGMTRTLQSYFRAPLMTEVKTYLASVIQEKQLNIFNLNAQLGVLSEALREKISKRFEEFGLSIPQFYITNISLPEGNRDFESIRALISRGYLGTKAEEINAEVAEAERKRKLIEAETLAQTKMIAARGEAEEKRTLGFAEAEVMRAKGYSEKDILEMKVQKAYAEGLGKMGGNGTAGGGVTSDLISMFAGMQLVERMTPQFAKISAGTVSAEKENISRQAGTWNVGSWVCFCGEQDNTGKFCRNCGKEKPQTWVCSCGYQENKGKYCEECGLPRATKWDCICGQKGNSGKCCPECGAKKPE